MKTTPVSCPHCGSSEELATIEHITGYAGAAIGLDERGDLVVEHEGYTEMDWDSSVSRGYWCNSCCVEVQEDELRGTAAPRRIPPARPVRPSSLQGTFARSRVNRDSIRLARESYGGKPPWL